MQDSVRFGLAHGLDWNFVNRNGPDRSVLERGRRTIDTRAAAAADLELLIAIHQPDAAGHCASCKAEGDITAYPCDPRLLREQAAIALQRRRSRAGGTAYEQRRC
jgi:hypothetical protein